MAIYKVVEVFNDLGGLLDQGALDGKWTNSRAYGVEHSDIEHLSICYIKYKMPWVAQGAPNEKKSMDNY